MSCRRPQRRDYAVVPRATSPPPADWPLSAGDLRDKAWDQRCALFSRLATAIVTDINISERTGDLLRKGAAEPEIVERAGRLVAFGQFAERAHAANEHLANAGLYGTSAAIEAMTLCVASDDIEDSLKPRLQSSAILAWNFVDVAAGLAASENKSKYYWQFRCTLRACHVLRAAAAIKPLVSDIKEGGNTAARRTDDQQRAAIADFDSTFDRVVEACTATLTQACQGSPVEVGRFPDWMWRFGVEDDHEDPLAMVHNTDQAVYLVSSLLVAVVRARELRRDHRRHVASALPVGAARLARRTPLGSRRIDERRPALCALRTLGAKPPRRGQRRSSSPRAHGRHEHARVHRARASCPQNWL